MTNVATATKRAVIYLRVSTAQQTKRDGDPEGYSISAQREHCLRKADSIGAVVVDQYVDAGESAKTADRPQLKAMLERIDRARDVDYVIVHKIDRLARSREDDVMITLTLKTAGVQLVSVTENIDDTPAGALLHGIMSSIAEFYSRNLANEILKGSVQKAKQGGTPNAAPIGYLNVRRTENGKEIRTVEVDPERAPLVQWAFEAYATGRYSLTQLLEAVTVKGLTNKPSANRAPRPMIRSRLSKMLHNKYYIGIVTYRGVEYPGKHTPLISRELFEMVQSVARLHDRVGERRRVHHHYLKSSIFCNRCGSRLTVARAKGNGGTYMYFLCLGRNRGTGCNLPYVRVEDVEDEVAKFYWQVQLEPNSVDSVRDQILDRLQRERQQHARESKRQQVRLARLTEKQHKLLDAYYADAIKLDLFKAQQAQISDEIEEANRVLSVRDLEFVQVETTIKKALDLAAKCAEAYQEAPDSIRRQFNRVFFTKLFVDVDRVRRAELTDEIAGLFAHGISRRFERSMPEPVLSGVGSIKEPLVELRGFEPLTS